MRQRVKNSRLTLALVGIALIGAAVLSACSKHETEKSDANVASTPGATAEGAAPGPDSEAPTDCKVHDCPADKSNTQIAGANLLDYDNGRVVCDFANLGKANYRVNCQAATIQPNGTTVAASGIAPGVSVAWQTALVQAGSASKLDCQVDTSMLNQSCLVETETSSVAVAFGLQIGDEAHKTPRLETSLVHLPFSVGVTAGLVMTSAQLYRSATESLPAASEVGFQPGQPLDGASIAIATPQDICATGEVVYFSVPSAIWELRSGKLTLFAGSATEKDGGTANHRLRVKLGTTLRLACSPEELLIADVNNYRVLSVRFATGLVLSIAGNGKLGTAGDGGLATEAQLGKTTGIAVDSDHSVYLADSGEYVIRKIDPKGIISIFAGNHVSEYTGDGGPATAASISQPSAVAIGPNHDVYFIDNVYKVIRKVGTNGVISTVVGQITSDLSSNYKNEGKLAITAALTGIAGLSIDEAQNLYFAETVENRIRRVDAKTGLLSTVLGPIPTGVPGEPSGGFAGDGGPAIAARVSDPQALTLTSSHELYIVDGLNQRIRKISKDLIASTAAGHGASMVSGDGGPATSAQLGAPSGVAFGPGSSILVSDSTDNLIRKIDANGKIATIAGTGAEGNSGDEGSALSAKLSSPSGIVTGADGSIYFADTGNHVVRKISAAGVITRFAGGKSDGGGVMGFIGDGGPATQAQLDSPADVGLLTDGSLLIADPNTASVRKVSPDGVISTFAGTSGVAGYDGDNGLATLAKLSSPYGIAVSADGSVYIADTANDSIRKVDATGKISTLSITLPSGHLPLHRPRKVSLGPKNELYVVDGQAGTRAYRLSEISAKNGADLVLRPLFGVNEQAGVADCAIGKVVNEASSAADLKAKIQSSLSVLCAGSEILALASKNSCNDPDPALRRFSLLFSQSFGGAGSNVVEVQKPCD